MKNLLVLGLIFIALSCSKKETVTFLKGDTGANGHSLASQFLPATELECPTGGTRLDLYLDNDDSLSSSEGDTYQGSLLACNGSNGLNGAPGTPGEQGPPGLTGPPGENGNAGEGEEGGCGNHDNDEGSSGHGGHVTSYNVNNCASIGGGYYAKKKSSSNVGIYTNSSCHGSSQQLNATKSTFWLSPTDLAVFVNSQTVRVLTFN